MIDLKVLFFTMWELFALILVGLFLGRKKVIDEASNKVLSNLAANVFCPAMVIGSIYSNTGSIDESLVYEALYSGIGLYIFLIVFAILLFKIIKVQDERIYKMSFIFYNTGFLGYPVVQSLYGDYAIFLFSILHFSFNVFVYSYGVILLKGKGNFQIRDMLTTGFIGSVVAMLLYFFHIELLEPVQNFFITLGDATVPVSMLVIGISLSFVPFKQILENKTMFIMVLLKLVGMPILVSLIIPFLPLSSLMQQFLLISAALPAASMIVILSNQYDTNTRLASSLVFVSTLFSIVTIPVMLAILL